MTQNDPNPFLQPIEYQQAVLSSMKLYETLIGNLYTIYASKFPEQENFWNTLAQEEQTHAFWVETLSNKLGIQKIYFNEQRFNLAPLKECIEDINEKIANTDKAAITFLQALAVSNDIENGMIEKKFFEVYSTDSIEIQNTLTMLKDATIAHNKKVGDAYENEKAGSQVVKKNKSFLSWLWK